jgi:ADP-ribose pyrophosphatase YjhB (NUDIX family)
MEPDWLKWSKKLQAIAQNGLTFSLQQYDTERYQQIQEIAAEILSKYSGEEKQIILDIFNKQEGYATPKVDVRGAAIRDNKILLVKEKADGKWTLPGGWADPNQTPSENVIREVQEESGFLVKTSKIVAVFDRTKQGHTPLYPFHVFKIFFLCEIIGGEAAVSNETTDVGFFAENEIPELSSGRVNLNQISLIFRHFREPELQTEFD